MKKAVMVFVSILLMLLPAVQGPALSYSKTIKIDDFDDEFAHAFNFPVYVQEGSTFRTEDRMVRVAISPRERMMWESGEGIYEDVNFFFKVSVSVTLSDAKGTVSEDFSSYLNCEIVDCDTNAWEGRLFWDKAGEEKADYAGKTFDKTTPLIVEDQYFKVTLNLVDFKKSADYYCHPDYFYYCLSDSECLAFLDSLVLRLGIDYSSSQNQLLTSYEDQQLQLENALQYEGIADEYFQAGKFQEAKTEYEKAIAIYDQGGEESKCDGIQEQIDLCNSFLDAQEIMRKGMQSFQEAAATDNYDEAIKEYENARSYFENAKAKFDEIDAAQSTECQMWINKCDDEIGNLEGVGRLRSRLIIIVLVIALVAVAGMVISRITKGKAPIAAKEEVLVLRVLDSQTKKEVNVEVKPSDRIGKVRQLIATKLGVLPLQILYNQEPCPPGKTVKECGLKDGARVEILTERKLKSREEKLQRLEERYREGKISSELYESLKKKLEEG
ncbi:MAG: hypothetical protein AYK18_08145 [Theionarchaea archaeon DG-70]|nr:MAG: hypothetical protein AYK18_08145 [Theionarchaea archaeon DG-70]